MAAVIKISFLAAHLSLGSFPVIVSIGTNIEGKCASTTRRAYSSYYWLGQRWKDVTAAMLSF